MNKTVYIIITLGLIMVIGIIFLGGSKESKQNIETRNGIQYITIDAKGGYSPKITTAKADMPTVIKLNTQGTFDCSSAVVIPSLSYRANLPPSGTTEVDVPAQKVGTKLQGLCAMGMYNFSINFN